MLWQEKVKENISFRYLMTKTQLYALILSELNIFTEKLNKIRDKSVTHNNYSIMCGFYCIAFMEYMLAGNFC